jgi:type 1 glutamine amidotransferase
MPLLVFSKTTGYRHDSIPAGIAALSGLGFAVRATEDSTVFTTDLSDVDAVVFLNTSGELLDGAQRIGLQRYLAGGGGFVGIHNAANTETGWSFFRGLIGARFAGHPPSQPGRILVEDGAHPATAHLPSVWARTDEWYDFDANPRPDVRVLLRVDEASYDGGRMGTDHPLAWCHEFAGVRCFYSALGHTTEAYSEPLLRNHLRGGIVSVLRR